MSRALCVECQRAIANCLCQFISFIDNKTNIVILQHPSEVKHNKSTVPLLAKSLNNCQVIIGENFSDNAEVNHIITSHPNACFLLYPSDQAIEISTLSKTTVLSSSINKPIWLFLLDGTWKKSYRMFALSMNIQRLPQLSLPENIKGQYWIRKTTKVGALSTLEACYHALVLIEDNSSKYQVLFDNFIKFNQHQLSFRPIEHQSLYR